LGKFRLPLEPSLVIYKYEWQALAAVERRGVARSTRYALEELMKIIRAPLSEERIVVRRGLRLLEGRTKIAVRENGSNASPHIVILRQGSGNGARMSGSSHNR